MNNSNEQTAELIETRNALVAELEKAVNAATHVGALKQSEWYQARKSYLVHLNERIG